IYYNVSAWYKLADKTRLGAWIAVGGAGITILGNVLLIPVMGVAGSAWAALTCYLFMTIAALWQGRKHYPIPYPVRRMGSWILGAIAAIAVMQVVRWWWAWEWPTAIAFNTMLIAAY